MPNWCNNSLTITGPKADVEAFIQKARGVEKDSSGQPSKLSFASLVPHNYDDPDFQDAKTDHIELSEEHPDFNWYRWQIAHWGTKWDVDADEVSLETSECFDGKSMEAVYGFNTAWNAPIEFYYAIAEQFPTLTIEAFGWEPGCSVWWSFFSEDGSSSHEEESIDTDAKLEDAIRAKLEELGYDQDSGCIEDISDNLCDWYLDDEELSEIPEAEVIIDTMDEDFIDLAKEAGFKKLKKKSSRKPKK